MLHTTSIRISTVRFVFVDITTVAAAATATATTAAAAAATRRAFLIDIVIKAAPIVGGR